MKKDIVDLKDLQTKPFTHSIVRGVMSGEAEGVSNLPRVVQKHPALGAPYNASTEKARKAIDAYRTVFSQPAPKLGIDWLKPRIAQGDRRQHPCAIETRREGYRLVGHRRAKVLRKRGETVHRLGHHLYAWRTSNVMYYQREAVEMLTVCGIKDYKIYGNFRRTNKP